MTLKERIEEYLSLPQGHNHRFFSIWQREGVIGEGEEQIKFLVERDHGISYENYYEEDTDIKTVYSFSSGDEKVYIEFVGTYSSYSGFVFDHYNFVVPVQVLVTEFRKT